MVQHLEHLLFYGADMNARNASGNTPLHVCAVNNQVRTFQPRDNLELHFLLQHADTMLMFLNQFTSSIFIK